jgi:hypothetical protein
MVKH